jgi:hypothetical protein
MNRLLSAVAVSLVTLGLAGCATEPIGPGWVTLIDGEKGLENWNRIGEANWRAEGGAIVADKGKGGFLVTKNSYKDFVIYAEFYAESHTNSGIFFRCSDPAKISAETCYEANIWDTRPDPIYGTGGIVNFASVNPMPKAGGRWNTYEIYVKGTELTVKLNGHVTVSIQDKTYAAGPFALQFGSGAKGAPGGPIKWRKVMVRPL